MAISKTINKWKITMASATLVAAVALSSPVIAKDQAGASDKEQNVVARLQRLEDTESIRVLLEHYIELNESRDYAAYAQLFAKEGELVLRRGRATGPAAIKALLDKSFGGAAAAVGPAQGSLHVLSNVKIAVEGNTAVATSRWTLISPGEDGKARVAGMGSYGDKLVRENGVWKFQQRTVYRNMPADAPAK